MMSPLALIALLASSHADCDDVRRVHALALAHGLDDSTLIALERRVCGVAAPNKTNDPMCIELSIASLLGSTSEKPLTEVDELRGVACSLGLSQQRFSWKNGNTGRTSGGSLYWPNGNTAKTSGGTWYWPNGNTAKTSGGTWYWPNGNTAKTSSGTFYLPSGNTALLEQALAPACGRWPDRCRDLATLGAIHADLQMAATLAMIWSTR